MRGTHLGQNGAHLLGYDRTAQSPAHPAISQRTIGALGMKIDAAAWPHLVRITHHSGGPLVPDQPGEVLLGRTAPATDAGAQGCGGHPGTVPVGT